MKQVATLLMVALLFFASVALPQAVNNTIKNFSVSGGTYTMELWTQYKSGVFHITHGEFAIRNANRGDDLGFPTITFEPRYGGAGWVGVSRFTPNAPAGPATYSWNADFASIVPSSSGEKVCTISFSILNPSAFAVFTWGTPYQYNGYTGFQGVINNNSGSDNEVLPIQLASFKATVLSGKEVSLTWTTASEINNYGFEPQRSFDGKTFASIAGSFVPGNGTTNQSHAYSYLDANPTGATSWRLKQIDLDGTITYTEPAMTSTTTGVEESMPTAFTLEQNYPNPFNPGTQIAFMTTKEGPVSLRVYDVLGREVATLVDEYRNSGQYTEHFNGSQLSSGVYVYILRCSEGRLTGRMILSK